MSLINQALKEEQRRRSTPAGTVNAPMVSMARRRDNSRGPILLVGFTVMGMALAGVVTAVFYFGSGFLDDSNLAISKAPSMSFASGAQEGEAAGIADNSEAAHSPDSSSDEQLTTVQKMLLEETPATPPEEAAKPRQLTAEQIRLQGIVNQLSIQGIRKSGKNTRVFMNGRIHKLGDLVDLENGLSLAGFTESELIFSDRSGNRYNKQL